MAEAVVASLRNNSSVQSVVNAALKLVEDAARKDGLFSLLYQCWVKADCLVDTSRIKLAALDALPAIVAAMRLHISDANTQQRACGALWALALNCLMFHVSSPSEIHRC
jgi:hypothetical protein